MLDTNNKPELVEDDVVVAMDYTLTIQDEVVDSSEGEEPLEFLQGHHNIIPGLEKELYGMKIGDSKKVTVMAKDAYGPVDPEAIVEVPREQFPPEIPLEEGLQLQVRDSEGDLMEARVAEMKADSVVLDFNHPLAGQDLQFDIKVVDLRKPTDEEMSHGHVHSPGHSHDDYDEEEFDEFDEDFEDEEEEE